MTKLKRTFVLILLLVTMVTALFPVPAMAIADPDNPTVIRAVDVYRHCLEEDDWLILVDYFIEYAVPPTETVTAAFLAVLLDTDGTTQIDFVAPYTLSYAGYTENGYNRGMVAIYLDAADASALTWNDAYSVRIAGNPMEVWAGAPPATTSAPGAFKWSSSSGIGSTQEELGNQVKTYAEDLNVAWDPLIMLDQSGVGWVLSTIGETYFSGVVADLRTMAPQIFTISTSAPQYENRKPSDTEAVRLAATVAGTPLDLSPTATAIGISQMWLGTGLFLVVLLVFLFFVVRALGIKIVLPISGVAIIVAGLMGFIPLALTVGVGVLALMVTGFLLFYRPSSA